MSWRASAALVALVMIALAVVPLAAKGPTVRLAIAGGALVAPITIDDTARLSHFHVWGDGFLGAVTTPVAPGAPRYEVAFFVELPRGGGVHKKYIVHYVKGPQPGEGFIYLPGRGEDGYRLNVGTIVRDGHDGKWHRATESWAAMLDRYLPS
jgi:hypothetical protein